MQCRCAIPAICDSSNVIIESRAVFIEKELEFFGNYKLRLAIAFQGQDHHCMELDTRGGQLWSSKEVLDRSLTFRPGHCHFLRWPVCLVRYTTDQLAQSQD